MRSEYLSIAPQCEDTMLVSAVRSLTCELEGHFRPGVFPSASHLRGGGGIACSAPHPRRARSST